MTAPPHVLSLKRPMASPMTESQKQVKMRLDIEAADLGYLLVPQSMYSLELKMAILPKLISRTMNNLSQSITVTLPCFPFTAAWALLPASLRTSTEDLDGRSAIWDAPSTDDLQLLIGDLMETPTSHGLTRSLKTLWWNRHIFLHRERS